MKLSLNAKMNSFAIIGGIFLALGMVYSKGRSDLIEEINATKEPEKKSAMPKATRKRS